jgi:hypothetical protein
MSLFILCQLRSGADIIELIFVLPFDAVLPLLPLSYQALILFFTCYGNAILICLFEVLRKSKTKYDDASGVDEFDYDAPAPIKEVELSKSKLWFVCFL